MKKIFSTLLGLGLLCSCTDNTPKQFAGFIEDATMNTVVVKDITSDSTQTFSTMNADMTQANGMLIGAPIIVDYIGALKAGTDATKVSVDATYCNAVGKWTMPDPIDSTAVMGIDLMIQGQAASINMATLVYTAWELQGEENKIILKGQSIGNGQTIELNQIGTLSQIDGKSLLTIDSVVYQKASF